ncbi:MAG: glycoside hydrolase family 3 N-terminal domain-containing protein [Crocinitomicaceae bacterium]
MSTNFNRQIIAIICLLLSFKVSANQYDIFQPQKSIQSIQKNGFIEYVQSSNQWADSVFKQMTIDEKIGQLFMVAAYSNKIGNHEFEIKNLITKHHIGGLIFFKGTPTAQARLTNNYQKAAKTPLMIGIDGEWGISMRLDSTTYYPRQMMLGAIQNEKLIYEMGKQIAEQCKIMGIHVNFAPVIDVNNNANNPVINNRSFGEQKENVSKLGLAYMNGMQDHGVMACGKHFPGHGDTDTDSHKALPTIAHSASRLDSLELFPFKQLIGEGLASMMVAHLYIPAYDNTANQASTLSPKIVNGLLKDSLKFKGLIFTDALNMKGVAKYYQPGEVDVRAIMAGNDVLLFPEDVPVAINKIKSAIAKGQITAKEIETSCLKILRAKAWTGAHQFKPINTKNLIDRLTPKKNELLNKKLANASITLLKNKNDYLPLKRLDSLKIVYLNIGSTSKNEFHSSLNQYASIPEIKISRSLSSADEAKLLTKLKSYDQIIIGFHRTNNSPRRNFGITKQAINLQAKLSKNKSVISVIFGNPYVLKSFTELDNLQSLIVCYQDTKYTRYTAGEVIMGGVNPSGKLPVTCTSELTAGLGLRFKKTSRLHFGSASELDIHDSLIKKIDDFALKGIKIGAYPGCQILAIKNGTVFYNKAFGHHTYTKKNRTKTSDLYDIASITKVASTTYSLMKMTNDNLIDIDKTLGEYIPEIVKNTPYKNTVIREMLAHQAGYVSWIPFYYRTLKNNKPSQFYYKESPNQEFSTKVADHLFITNAYADTIFDRITSTDLRRKRYKYSDLGYYFLKAIIEKQNEKKIEKYVDEAFYKPMGLERITYHPLKKFDKSEITPTEYDTIFRKQLIHGYVHDPGAAMLGGAGGHAGLFSNALDLGILMYTLINDGQYGGQQILDPKVISDFTKCQFCPTNRRGAGFDKPVTSLNGGPTCSQVSLSSFGHSGFTGTIAWADPEHDIVYVFLSNRVYPNANNWLITKKNIRTDIQNAIYNAAK